MSLTLVKPHDFWWHVRAGQWILENGQIPDRDLFSFTMAGEPYGYVLWWLADVLLYLLLQSGGLPLVIFFAAVVITTAYGVLLRLLHQISGDLRWAATTTILAAIIGIWNWAIRPQIISFLFFALTLYLIERDERGLFSHRGNSSVGWSRGRAIWLLPPIFALWANIHGAFVVGLALVGTYVLSAIWEWYRQRSKPPILVLLVGLLSSLATLVTPAGWRTPAYALSILSHPVVQQSTMEWAPPTLGSQNGRLFFGFVIVWLILVTLARYRPTSGEYLRFLVFGVIALLAVRNTSWFGFVAAPSLAIALRDWRSKRVVPSPGIIHSRKVFNLVLTLIFVAGAILSLPWLRPYLPLSEAQRQYVSSDTPVRATAYLQTLASAGRVFQGEGYGSYMIWAYPKLPVFIDSRIDLYPPAQWQDHMNLTRARYDWEAILERYRIDTLFLEQERQQPLIDAASADPDWTLCYEDEGSMILQRRELGCR